jgi:hypothetical protein
MDGAVSAGQNVWHHTWEYRSAWLTRWRQVKDSSTICRTLDDQRSIMASRKQDQKEDGDGSESFGHNLDGLGVG